MATTCCGKCVWPLLAAGSVCGHYLLRVVCEATACCRKYVSPLPAVGCMCDHCLLQEVCVALLQEVCVATACCRKCVWLLPAVCVTAACSKEGWVFEAFRVCVPEEVDPNAFTTAEVKLMPQCCYGRRVAGSCHIDVMGEELLAVATLLFWGKSYSQLISCCYYRYTFK